MFCNFNTCFRYCSQLLQVPFTATYLRGTPMTVTLHPVAPRGPYASPRGPRGAPRPFRAVPDPRPRGRRRADFSGCFLWFSKHGNSCHALSCFRRLRLIKGVLHCRTTISQYFRVNISLGTPKRSPGMKGMVPGTYGEACESGSKSTGKTKSK